jgi:hypothetical protein
MQVAIGGVEELACGGGDEDVHEAEGLVKARFLVGLFGVFSRSVEVPPGHGSEVNDGLGHFSVRVLFQDFDEGSQDDEAAWATAVGLGVFVLEELEELLEARDVFVAQREAGIWETHDGEARSDGT